MSDGGRFGDDGRTSGPADVGAVFASPRRRFLAFAAVLTAIVAVLAGVAANLALFGPLTRGLSRPLLARSDLATVLTTLVLRVFLWTSLGLYVLVPAAVGGYLVLRGDRHWLAGVVWAAVAVLGLGVLVAGAAGGGVVAGSLDDLVLVGHGWDFDYEATGDGQGLLTVTNHGESARADSITLHGTGFADVAGADQTEPGPWRGEATGTLDGESAIARGDSVTVGVTSDCEISIVLESPGGGYTQRLGQYECGSDAGDDAGLEPPRLGGGR